MAALTSVGTGFFSEISTDVEDAAVGLKSTIRSSRAIGWVGCERDVG